MKYLFSLILVLGMLVGTSSASTLTGSPQFFGSPVPNGSLEFLRKNCGVEQTFTFVLNGAGLASGSLTGTDVMTGCQGTPYYKITLRNASGQLLWIKNALVTGGSWSTVGFTELSPLPPDVAFSNNAGVAGVSQFAGRSGIVTPSIGDYLASQVTNAFDISAYNDLTTIVTPGANPSAGKVRLYAKTSIGRLCVLNSSGQESCGVNPTSAVPHQWLNAVLSDGTFTQSRPDFSDLSGTSAVVQTNQANTFGSFLQKFKAGSNFQLTDFTDTTKILQFDLSNIATGQTRTVNIPNANSTTIQPASAPANQFSTGFSAQGVESFAAAITGLSNVSHKWLNSVTAGGVFTQTQPDFTDVSGTATATQVPLAQAASALTGFAVRIANSFSGSDLGAKINAADADLGASAGDIWAFGGGAITTQIVVSSNHTLHLFSGTYTNALGLRIPVVRLQDNSSLIGVGIQTIVQESSNAANTTPVIVCAYDLGSTCSTLTPSTVNIHVSGIHFQGANPNVGTSLIDSVSLGNCLQCSVNDNWFDSIKSSHILIGGTSGSSFWSDGFEVSGNNFSGAGNCSVCVINGQNISIHDNFWRLHGNGAAADIDIEPNATTDHAQGIDIHDNLFDESLSLNTVFCVTMQNGQFVAMGRVKIHDNHCDGGPFTTFGNVGATGTFKLTGCFGAGPGPVNTMSDVEIYNNTCRVVVQAGISLVGVNRGYVHDNIVQCTNDYAIALAGSVTNSLVERNKVMTVTSPDSCGQNPGGSYKSSSIAETNANNANNVFRDNIAIAVTLNGTGSQAPGGALVDGSGLSFRVPAGLNGGAAGGVRLATVGAPVLVQKAGNFGGSCVLSSATYFYKVRAVTAGGGLGVPSNEITFNNGGGFGCGGIKWNKLAGAASYNIYRSTTTNTELLIANVADGSTFFDDLGGQTPTTAIDNNDSSIGVVSAESTPPAGIASSDILWSDSASHCWKFNANNAGSSGCIPGIGIAQTWAGTQTFSSVASITSATANPATTQFLRLAKTDAIDIRNNANSADLNALSLRSSDVLQLGDAAGVAVGTSSAAGTMILDGPAASLRALSFTTAGVNRWFLRANNTAEGGSNAGSDLDFVSRDDSGALLAIVLSLKRSNSVATFASSVFAPAFASTTANPATTGLVRLAKTDTILVRNNANSADLNALSLRVNDILQLGDAGGAVVGTSSNAGTMAIDGPAAANRSLVFNTAGVNRWILRASTAAESGGNVGSDLQLTARDDSGALLSTPFTVRRSDGLFTLATGVNSPFFSSTTANPASAGQVRLAKTDCLNFRNNAASADVAGICLNGADQVTLGGTAGVAPSSVPAAAIAAVDNSIISAAVDGTGSPIHITTAVSTSALPINGGTTNLSLYIAGKPMVLSSNVTVTLTTGVNYIYALGDTSTPSNGSYTLSSSDFVASLIPMSYSYVAPSCSNGANVANGVGGFFSAAAAGNPHYWFNMTTNQMNICTSSGGSFTATSYGGANAPAILIGKAYYDGTSILAVGPMPTGASPKIIVHDLGTGADGALSITSAGTTTKDGLFYVTTLDVITGTLTHTAGNVNAQTTGLAFYSQNPIIVYNGTVNANSKGRGAAGSGSTGAGSAGSSGGFGGAGGGGGGSATAAGGLGGQHQTPLFPSLGNGGGTGGVIGSNGSNGSSALSGMVNLSLFATYQPFCSGASGGAGAGDGTNNGGLSNVGGGYILLRGASVTLGGSALLDANGGNGQTGVAGNAAGGAGAGGGCAFIAGGATYGGVLDTNMTVNGGASGVHFGAGTGKDGGTGGKGLNAIFRIW
jgi:hypothetical protein